MQTGKKRAQKRESKRRNDAGGKEKGLIRHIKWEKGNDKVIGTEIWEG